MGRLDSRWCLGCVPAQRFQTRRQSRQYSLPSWSWLLLVGSLDFNLFFLSFWDIKLGFPLNPHKVIHFLRGGVVPATKKLALPHQNPLGASRRKRIWPARPGLAAPGCWFAWPQPRSKRPASWHCERFWVFGLASTVKGKQLRLEAESSGHVECGCLPNCCSWMFSLHCKVATEPPTTPREIIR